MMNPELVTKSAPILSGNDPLEMAASTVALGLEQVQKELRQLRDHRAVVNDAIRERVPQEEMLLRLARIVSLDPTKEDGFVEPSPNIDNVEEP